MNSMIGLDLKFQFNKHLDIKYIVIITSFTECDNVPSYNYSSYAVSYSKTLNDIVVAGSQVTYSCDSSYQPSSSEALLSTCQNDGTWNSTFVCHPGVLLEV